VDPNRDTIPYEESLFECMQRPLEFLSVFTVCTALAEVVSRPLVATGMLRYIRVFRELGVIVAGTWFLTRWIDRIRVRFAADKRTDKSQVDAIARISTVIIGAIATLISFDTIGVNVQTVLAFGGIGGVAIGFAGREIISNFFGGFMIYMTRPFIVGEWIRAVECEDVDGTVEQIGWYLTTVRRWDKRPLYVPNSKFSTLIVENPSRMTNRRIRQDIRIRIDDVAKAKKIVQEIHAKLVANEELDPKQHRLVHIEHFDKSGVSIWLSCYTKSVFLGDYRRIQENVLLDAYQVIALNGAQIASDLVRDVRLESGFGGEAQSEQSGFDRNESEFIKSQHQKQQRGGMEQLNAAAASVASNGVGQSAEKAVDGNGNAEEFKDSFKENAPPSRSREEEVRTMRIVGMNPSESDSNGGVTGSDVLSGSESISLSEDSSSSLIKNGSGSVMFTSPTVRIYKGEDSDSETEDEKPRQQHSSAAPAASSVLTSLPSSSNRGNLSSDQQKQQQQQQTLSESANVQPQQKTTRIVSEKSLRKSPPSSSSSSSSLQSPDSTPEKDSARKPSDRDSRSTNTESIGE